MVWKTGKAPNITSEDLLAGNYTIPTGVTLLIPFDSAKHWGANHFTGVLSMTFATISFGLFVYSIVDTIVKASKQ